MTTKKNAASVDDPRIGWLLGERREFIQAPAMAKSPENVRSPNYILRTWCRPHLCLMSIQKVPTMSTKENPYSTGTTAAVAIFMAAEELRPPLMDADWIYGDAPQNVFNSIVEGRPNDAQLLRKIPEYQVWQLVAYVRSMSGQLPKDISLNRDDRMMAETSGISSTPANILQGNSPI